MVQFVGLLFALLLVMPAPATSHPEAELYDVSLVQEGNLGVAAHHGWGTIQSVLVAKGIRFEQTDSPDHAHGRILICAGLASGGIAQQLSSAGIAVPQKPESLVIHKTTLQGRPLLLVSGRDDRGLMYALLEVAERIGWARGKGAPLSEVENIIESPDVADRGVTIFTMQKHQYEDRLHDEKYWINYFDMLAEDRFNTIEVKFAYEANGYNCPVYPYYMDVAGFPDVRVSGLSKQEQQQNLADLHRLVRLAHERGIRVQFGIWCHYDRFTPTFQLIDHSKERPFTVTGLSEANLVQYTLAAIKQFLREFHDIDSVQLLMMDESGLKTEDMQEFWKNIFPALKEAAPNLQFELRAKGVSDDLIKQGLDLGLKIRINTKVWAEKFGPPYFQTRVQELDQFNRRGGYADMLRYPRTYKLHWTLWTVGSMRVLLWGNPEYVRRFAQSTHLGEADGFDIYEPLATKMAGHAHDLKPFDLLAPQYRYYDYEFQRYWYFFKLFGRLTYNPATSAQEWNHEFASRLGAGPAPYVEKALSRASEILPQINAYCLPDELYSTTRGWTERQRQGDLPEYVEATPSDPAQFESLKEAADDALLGRRSAKMTPEKTSTWFAQHARDVRGQIALAEQSAGPHPSKEFASTIVDLRILSDLAEYHSRRVLAGLTFALFEKSHDLNMLDDAIQHEGEAVNAWAKIVKDAGDFYNFDLKMGLPQYDLSGHWRDELVKLEDGLDTLKKQRAAYKLSARRVVGRYYFGNTPSQPGYQHITSTSTPALSQRAGTGLVSIDLPDGRYEVDINIRDDQKGHGPMWIELNGVEYSDQFTVPAGTPIHRTMETSVIRGKLNVLFDHATSADWFASSIVVTRLDPVIAHVPIRRLGPKQDLNLRATVSGATPLRRVRAFIGNAVHGFTPMEMKPDGPLYTLRVPTERLGPNAKYFLEATDAKGRLSTFPENGRTNPIAVQVSGDDRPPTLTTVPIHSAEPLRDLRIRALVQDPSGVKWVHLLYRGVSEHQDLGVLNMLPTGRANEYQATIPGIEVDPHYDLMYLFEVMDNSGNGRIYPDMDKETPYTIVPIKEASAE
jgi:hypothetical protein